MARRKGGEYDDPELAKVLEEREKKEEKAKRDRAKSGGTSGAAKRGHFGSSASRSSGYGARQNNSPLAAVDQSSSRSRGGGYARRPQTQAPADLKCYVCGGFGHYFKYCPDRKM